MRASDADRDIVLTALGDAYADGRIDRDELDERTDSVNSARTLGELVPLLADLVPVAASHARVRPSPDVQAQAVAKWQKSRREALMGFLTPVLICWAIWAVTMFGGFPWPVFVMIPTGLGLISTLVRRQDIIESNERKILKKQAEELEKKPGPPELEG
jgi:hypothetical protein